MLSQKMQDALNGQANAELYSAYLYLAMSAYLQSVKLSGFANWMRVQAQEEMVHTMKFYDYVHEQGGRVILGAVEAPPAEWDSPLAVSEQVRQHEQKVTGLINDLVAAAEAEKDDTTKEFLQWYIKEQEEEEESAEELVEKVKLAGDAPDKLSVIDRELAQRQPIYTKK